MSEYFKVASLTVKDGAYKKDGEEKTRHQDVGVIISTEHGSNMFIKLNATAYSESRVLNLKLEDGYSIKVEKDRPMTQVEALEGVSRQQDVVPKESEIPF